MYEIILKHTADKELKKIEKGDKIGALKIRTFLQELEKIEARQMQEHELMPKEA